MTLNFDVQLRILLMQHLRVQQYLEKDSNFAYYMTSSLGIIGRSPRFGCKDACSYTIMWQLLSGLNGKKTA